MLIGDINHGLFRKYARWETQTETLDEFGRKDPDSWTEVLGQRCQIKPRGFFERDEAGKETAKSGIEVITRFRKEIAYDESLRINYKGRIYDIESIENVEEMDVYLVFDAITTSREAEALAHLNNNPMGGLDGSILGPLT